MREEVDEVDPETVLFVEGAGDTAREFANGFITHSHDWTGRRFDLYPELTGAPLAERAVEAEGCLAELFDAVPAVVTVGNATPQPVSARVRLPVRGSVLLDRVDARWVPLRDGVAALDLAPGEFRAFEVRA